MITTHLLPDTAFTALAEGAGGPDAVTVLCDVQQSKHLMLLHAIAEAAAADAPGSAAFRAGYELLTRIRAADSGAGAWLLGLPHLGGWAHDCLIRLEQGTAPDLAHFACLAAATAVRAGLPFRLDLPVRQGRVLLPGLGSVRIPGQPPPSWITLCCDGERVTAGDYLDADWRELRPDGGGGGGGGGELAQWSGTPAVRAVAAGMTWSVLLETDDPYLDRYTLPMSVRLDAGELRRWRHLIQSAWDLLVRHHRWAAEPIADGLSVIVPLTPESETDLVSATSPAAFGAIATSWPPDSVTLAETLVHEFQHVKLGGLMDMVPLAGSGQERVYAPWRQDPRPAAGLLQGAYAHLGIVRFWIAQQYAETDADDILRAQVHVARWRPATGRAIDTLLGTCSLTPAGARFAGLLRDQARDLRSEPVPGDALQIAAEAALDHWLTWQLRHTASDAADVASLAAAYQRGEPFPAGASPRTWIQADTRKVDSAVRSRLLNMRYLMPARYRELCTDGVLPLSEPDRLLIENRADAAAAAYRTEIAGSADPQPDAWTGLALALHRLPPTGARQALASHLALIFDVHACLGAQADPLDLAGWFA